MAESTKQAGSERKTASKARRGVPGSGRASKPSGSSSAPAARGKHLVIVESPTKAKTINQYLGHDFVVMASVGHVRDLPSRSPKGQKQEVPGVDLEHNFQPTYEVLPEKKKTVTDLRKAAKEASDVWFATDLDREGEAIAWHLAQALGVPPDRAKRVVFNAITKAEIGHAFANPRPIDQHKVDAQQARRILDRIVGYQVSPLLWKKVAGGLSAGRVQSVAVRLVVEREREIEAFVPEEFWKITGYFATDLAARERLASAWRQWLTQAAEGKERTLKEKLAWLSEHRCLRAELVEVDGKPFEAADRQAARRAAERLGLVIGRVHERHDPNGKGPAAHLVVYEGHLQSHPGFVIRSVQTKRTTSRPSAPFITSTMQQAAANRLGFSLKHTMDIAQQLYEGVDLHGSQGRVGLITYMRTDSTHLSPEALEMARSYIQQEWGDRYLPAKPQQYASSNKSAQEAHEAIRPTDVRLTPKRVRGSLTEHQYRLYQLVWERFVASQMTPAEWDSTTVIIGTEPAGAAFKATGRTLVFDGFYKAAGLPSVEDEAVLPALMQGQPVAPLQIDPTQHFTSPPPRYTEASLQKKLEEEGIGRPSTYAAIIQTIQDRKYVQKVAPGDRRLYATDLGKVVTDKLIEGFPRIMDVAYTRTMEAELDKIEEKHLDWVTMLRRFYGPFKENLDTAHQSMTHAKAQTEPAPFKCEKCGAPTVYRFGRNGRFLSCSRYPDCDFAAPIGRDGKPVTSHLTDIVCPVCGAGMTRRTGRFGPFLGCENYPKCKGVVKLDPKKGTVVLPKPPPLQVDVPCPKCGSALNLRRTKRGPWLSCSRFPKCRGRLPWSALEPAKQAELEQALAAHEAANPVPVIRTVGGRTVGEGYVPRVQESDGVSAAAPEASEVGSDAA